MDAETICPYTANNFVNISLLIVDGRFDINMELGHCLWAIPVVIVDNCFTLFDQSWIVISSQHNKQLKPPPPYISCSPHSYCCFSNTVGNLFCFNQSHIYLEL